MQSPVRPCAMVPGARRTVPLAWTRASMQRFTQLSSSSDIQVVRRARHPGRGPAEPAVHRVDRGGELSDVQRVVRESQRTMPRMRLMTDLGRPSAANRPHSPVRRRPRAPKHSYTEDARSIQIVSIVRIAPAPCLGLSPGASRGRRSPAPPSRRSSAMDSRRRTPHQHPRISRSRRGNPRRCRPDLPSRHQPDRNQRPAAPALAGGRARHHPHLQ